MYAKSAIPSKTHTHTHTPPLPNTISVYRYFNALYSKSDELAGTWGRAVKPLGTFPIPLIGYSVKQMQEKYWNMGKKVYFAFVDAENALNRLLDGI